MPDERLIHLAVGHSEKFNRLTDFERLVWLVYKLASDDFGVMRRSAAPLTNAARFLEVKPAKSVLRALETVIEVGLIQTFQHQGQPYVYQWDWQTWQKITHPRTTEQPKPPADVIASCDLNTQWLFTHHPKGGKLSAWQHPSLRKSTGTSSGKDRELTGSPPGKVPACVCVGVCVCVRGRVRDRSAGGARLAYDGRFLTVFPWQYTELGKRLALAQREDFDLTRWLEGVEADLERSGEPLPSENEARWKWLQARLYRDADLPLPHLMGKKTAGNLSAADQFLKLGGQR